MFSPDSKAIIATNHFPFTLDDKVVEYDARTGEMGKWVGKLPPWNHIERTHDGLLVVSGPSLMVYDYVKEEYPEEFKPLLAKRDRLSQIQCASLSPDRKQIVAITQKGARRPLTTKVVVEQVATDELIDVLEAKDATFNRCCWAPDGKSFAVGTAGYRGIHGNQGDRLSGHVLIFRPKE